MRRHISQREAQALAKRVDELEREREQQRSRWARDYPGGTYLGFIDRERDWFSGILEGVAMLNHAIVAKPNATGKIDFHALPLPK